MKVLWRPSQPGGASSAAYTTAVPWGSGGWRRVARVDASASGGGAADRPPTHLTPRGQPNLVVFI
jgi:hypothetical protein